MTPQVKSELPASTTTPRSSRSAFTLIELLLVISIIAVIMGMVLGAGRMARGKAVKARAKAEMEHIANALMKYNLDFGVFPPNLTTIQNNLPANVDLTDPWGSQYVYVPQPGTTINSYTLYSRGPRTAASESSDDIYQGR